MRTTRHADATAEDTKPSRSPTLGTFDLLVQQLPVGGIQHLGGSTTSTCQWCPQPSADKKNVPKHCRCPLGAKSPSSSLHRWAAGTGDDQVYTRVQQGQAGATTVTTTSAGGLPAQSNRVRGSDKHSTRWGLRSSGRIRRDAGPPSHGLAPGPARPPSYSRPAQLSSDPNAHL